jgi:8-oxo-dGTP diphosphatase
MRLRATVLLTRHQAVLLVRQRGGPWLLPGATVQMDELAMVAAIRGLHRDTGVEANAVAYLFEQTSAQHVHSVYRIAIPDASAPRPNPLSEYDEMRWADPSQLVQLYMTPGTRAILRRALGPDAGIDEMPDRRQMWRTNGMQATPTLGFFRKR